MRGLGPMLAIELVEDPATKRPAAELAKRTTEIARERGLVLLSCGLYGNVLRVLVPILAEESDVDEGLEILESVSRRGRRDRGLSAGERPGTAPRPDPRLVDAAGDPPR